MGGEGSMASAILSLKQNRALLKKRSVRELKDLLYEKSGKTEVEFKKVTPEELVRIKEEIRKDTRVNIRNEIIIYTISFVAVLVLFFLIYLLFFG